MREGSTRSLHLSDPVKWGSMDKASRESEDRYERLLALTPDAVVLQSEGRVLYVNPACLRLFGAAAAEDLVGRSLTELVDVPLAIAEGAAPTAPVETRASRMDGSFVAVDVSSIPIPWLGNLVQQVVIRDATERKLAGEKLHRQALAFENLYDAVIISDLDGRIVDWNPAAERIYGFTRAEVIGKTASLWRPTADDEDVSDRILKSVEREGRWFGEIQYQRKDGVHGVTETIVVPLLDENGHRVGHVGVNHDVTERRRASRALEHSLSVLQATLESTTDGILVVDLKGRIVTHNRKFAEMWRIPAEPLAQRSVYEMMDEVVAQVREPADYLRALNTIAANRQSQSFDVLRLVDGRVYEQHSLPQRVDGATVGRVWSFRDVTQRERAQQALRESEEQLRQAQKLEAIGLLAGGIAHDFSNLLTVIQAYADSLSRSLDAGDAARRHEVGEIRRVLDQATSLTRQLLAFGRKEVVHRRVLDLNAIVRDLQSMLRRVIGEDIDLATELPDDVGFMEADQGQLEQVLLNLALNARDAMPRGGTLTIRTASAVPDADFARQHLGADVAPGRYVVLTVADSGHGMDAATRERIFEPFFTTKDKSRGTGLGLSTVYGIVKQSGGHIWVESAPGSGAAFHIYFPQVIGVVSTAAGEQARPARGNATILLVEDDDDLRAVTRAALERNGYAVIDAGAGDDVAAVAAAAKHVDLVVSDVVLPHASAPDVARAVRARHPGVRVLFVSGYVPSAELHEQLRAMQNAFLEKPFAMDTLLQMVGQVLAP